VIQPARRATEEHGDKMCASEDAMFEYRIETSGDQFVVIDSFAEVVDKYDTAEAAERSIEQCKREDVMYETAKQLIESAVAAHMEQFNVSREIAGFWIRGAAEGA
jgi:hypothetical protein